MFSDPLNDPPARDGAARTAEADFTRLFNLSLDLLCIAGLDGYFRRVNPSWTRVLGWTEAELLARPVADFMHPEDRQRTLEARAALAAGTPLRDFENRYRCKDGSYRWLSWQSIAEPREGMVFAVARDITERRQLDHEQLLMSKLESTGILAGGIAHDFNNLLTTLALNVDMIGLSGPLAPAQEAFLLQARESVRAAKGITDQLVAFAAGSLGARESTDLEPTLRAALDAGLLGSALKGELVVPPDLWRVEIDPTQIGQVIRSLILNAREAAPRDGRVCLRAANLSRMARTAAEAPNGDCVSIEVSDTGCGIPAKILPKVFDPYFSTKQRGAQKGMGLGLTICRAVIRRHGGHIRLESKPGCGTTVTCLLPRAGD